MEPIRLASPEEIEALRPTSELAPPSAGSGTTVYACGNQRAVIRLTTEMDPVIFDGSTAQRAAFIWALEGILRTAGIPLYYFSVPARPEAEQYRKQVEKFGAICISPEPELRYKKIL